MSFKIILEEIKKFNLGKKRLLTFNNTAIIGIATLLIIGAILVFISNYESKNISNNVFIFIINAFTVTALFYAAKYTKTYDKYSYRSWLFLAFAQLSFMIGDVLWGILEIGLNQDPTFSLVNIFYLIYYPLFAIGILILPKVSLKDNKRLIRLIEIGIIMISAFFLSLFFFFEPLIQINEGNALPLILLICVFMDFFLFLALVDLLFNWLSQINRLPYLILVIGIFIKVVIDFTYLYQLSFGTYISGGMVDLGWTFSYIFFILAAITQINDKKIDLDGLSSKYIPHIRKMQFNIYFPILLLSGVYFLFIWADYNVKSLDTFFLEIFFGIILFLAILRQFITFKENKENYLAAKKEIERRKIIEAKLNQVLSSLDNEVQKRTEEHEKLIEELKRSNKELEIFAYVASHDLQEPLRTIASFTQLLERRYKGKLDDDADEFIDFIVDGSKRMKQIILDLLEYSRISTRGQEFRPVNTENILNQVLNSLKILISENNAAINFNNLPNVIADEGQLIRVFQNLITNAIKFKGNETPKIHISAEEKENEYVFSVADNGIGIEEQYFERIFTIFQRLHTMDEYPGTGIGLSVTKRIIERHGGHIWVKSELGSGSAFHFTILKDPFSNSVISGKFWDYDSLN